MPKTVAANISENNVGDHRTKFKLARPGKSEFDFARIGEGQSRRNWTVGIRTAIAD
jgi:hypothetical protein